MQSIDFAGILFFMDVSIFGQALCFPSAETETVQLMLAMRNMNHETAI
jgi:hypothetical protein